jgi:hypothetical protein
MHQRCFPVERLEKAAGRTGAPRFNAANADKGWSAGAQYTCLVIGIGMYREM